MKVCILEIKFHYLMNLNETNQLNKCLLGEVLRRLFCRYVLPGYVVDGSLLPDMNDRAPILGSKNKHTEKKLASASVQHK
jgi:hypothetical protein